MGSARPVHATTATSALLAGALVLCLAAAGGASPNRIAALGGESRFLLDATNVHEYPALAVSLGHAGLELYDEWGGAVLPLGRGAVGLYANRPSAPLRRYNAWIDALGLRPLARLDVQPWIEAVAGLRLDGDRAVGLKLCHAADLDETAAGEASASLSHVAAGLRLGPGHRRVDLALHLRRYRLRDRTVSPSRRQSDGDALALQARGRWQVGEGLLAVPVVAVETGSLGLAPATGERRRLQVGLALNARPTASVLAVAGLLVDHESTRQESPAGPRLDQWTAALPALVGGAEVHVGSLTFRAGLRHEAVRAQTESLNAGGQVVRTRTFDAGMRTDVGLGMVFGDLRLDGVLEKDFLRDGPHFIGGSRRGGGLFANLSLEYLLGRGSR